MIVGCDDARSALRWGKAVVLPNPEPLTHVVAATNPEAVNAAKGRPVDQSVAVWAHDPDTLGAITAVSDLDQAAVGLARRLLADERVTLLVPVRENRPDWLAPAVKDGWALLFGARWSLLLPVLGPFPLLYVSSANRTGQRPAATTAEAVGMFPAGTPVLGFASASVESTDRRATTTLRLHADGRLDLHRHGAQDHPHSDARAYLDSVRARCSTSEPDLAQHG